MSHILYLIYLYSSLYLLSFLFTMAIDLSALFATAISINQDGSYQQEVEGGEVREDMEVAMYDAAKFVQELSNDDDEDARPTYQMDSAMRASIKSASKGVAEGTDVAYQT